MRELRSPLPLIRAAPLFDLGHREGRMHLHHPVRASIALFVYVALLAFGAALINPIYAVNFAADLICGALLCFALLRRFPWAYLGYAIRNAICAINILCAAVFVIREASHIAWIVPPLLDQIGVLAELAFAGRFAIFQTNPARTVASLSVAAPLAGRIFVVSGGASAAVNHHVPFEPFRYAVDLVLSDDLGKRAKSLASKELRDYYVYYARVYAPIGGIVTDLLDGSPDLKPGISDDSPQTGNFIEITSGPYKVVLAHLSPGSICVRRGEPVQAGQRIANVGSSGNSTEPHLHMHATVSDRSVPLLVRGKFLIRNDVLVA